MREELSPWAARGLYLFGFALILHAAIDLSTTVWPLRWAELTWRYGFFGLAAGYLQTPTLGLVIIAGTAMWEERPLVLRSTGVVFALSSLALLGVTGIFGLDVLAMRELRAPDARSSVLAGGVLQEIKYVVSAAIFACLALGLSKMARRMAAEASKRPKKPGIVSTGS